MSMSERNQQALDFTAQSGAVSSCQANGDSLGAGGGGGGDDARIAADGQASAIKGGGPSALATPPSPLAREASPPCETRVEGGPECPDRGRGGAATSRGRGMDAFDRECKLRLIKTLGSVEEVEGYVEEAGRRGFFPGEQFALITRYMAVKQGLGRI